jgi:cyclophilin family peptidyl-prolyl cis-trans isomerase
MAARARERAVQVEAERRAREEDDARGDLPLVLLRTNRGAFVVQVFATDVPKAAAQFLALVDRTDPGSGRRTYDGTFFHRVLGAHLAQGGDPKSREGCQEGGRGEAPLTVEPERNARHGFWRGAVGFALGPDGKNGCQFFVLTAPRPELTERGFTCFGRVASGMDVVDRLEQCDVLLEARVLAGGR